MYRRSFTRLGVFSVFLEELKKVPAYFSYKAQKGAEAYVGSASQTLEFLKGEDPSESPEMREKRRKHKEMYNSILNQQAVKAAEEKAKVQQERAQLSWAERLQLSLKEAKEAATQMTSTKAGVMALLQHCTASHAAEVAIEQGIDVKNVQMVFEKAATAGAVGFEDVVVGYIDAPAASREEVMAFAEKLHKACPVANTMHIEWRQGRSDGRDRGSGDARRADALQEEMDRAARRVDWEESRSGFRGQPGSSPRTVEEDVPRGMPGAWRARPSTTRSASSRFRDEDDAFHLPGVRKAKDEAATGTPHHSSDGATAAASSFSEVPPKSSADTNTASVPPTQK